MELEQIVSTNLTALRKKREWTQAELADKINYSDTSVSKWERGEALPDLKVLTKLAELYGVTIDYFLTENANDTPEKFTSPALRRRYQYWIISLFVCLIWLVATTIFVYTAITTDDPDWQWRWRVFVWALPVTFLALVFFDYRYFSRRLFIIFTSLFVWTLITAIFIEYYSDANPELWVIYLIGIPAEAIIFLMDQMRRIRKK